MFRSYAALGAALLATPAAGVVSRKPEIIARIAAEIPVLEKLMQTLGAHVD